MNQDGHGLDVEWVAIGEVFENPANPRLNDHAVEGVAASLRRFGWQQPIVAKPSGEVVAGNTRLKAARAIGHETIPVVRFHGSDLDATAFAIADNRTGEKAEWDDPALANLLEELRAEDALEGVGYTDEEVGALLDGLRGKTETEEDEAPEPPDEAVTKPGDLWLLGEHRVLCGDSKDPAQVEALLDGNKASLVFTDPPYGVAIGAKNRLLNNLVGSKANTNDIVDDSLKPKELAAQLLPTFTNIRKIVMADDCTVFVTAPQGGELCMMMMMMMQEAGLRARHVLIWKKNSPTFSLGRLDYDYQHEPILLTWGKRHKRPMKGEHRTSVWEIDKPRASPEHPTMKPVALPANAMLNNSERGDLVFDAYLGSGTTLIAAEQLNRRCFGLEIEPRYCDVIVQRWETLTGKDATLEETGQTFEEVERERKGGDDGGGGSDVRR
jgi:DNA modification methylase